MIEPTGPNLETVLCKTLGGIGGSNPAGSTALRAPANQDCNPGYGLRKQHKRIARCNERLFAQGSTKLAKEQVCSSD